MFQDKVLQTKESETDKVADAFSFDANLRGEDVVADLKGYRVHLESIIKKYLLIVLFQPSMIMKLIHSAASNHQCLASSACGESLVTIIIDNGAQ